MSKRQVKSAPQLQPRPRSSRIAEPAVATLHPALVCLLLVAATLATYWPLFRCDFIGYDDTIYVTENWHVLQGLSWPGVDWAFTNLLAGFWHPLTWLSLMLDASLYGQHAWGFHLTNLLLHLGSTLILFATLRRATGALWRSAVVAALFALHPLHVEAAAWIGERKEVLSAFFELVSLYFYVCYAKQTTSDRQSKSGNYCWALFFFLCGLMSKPMVVTLPLVMLLLDYWPLKRMEAWWKLLLEKVPYFAPGLVVGLVTVYAEKAVGAVSSTGQVPMSMRVSNAIVSYVRYLEQTFWPVNLSIFYPYPRTISLTLIAVSALLLGGISVVAGREVKRRPYVTVGWFWYVITLLLVSGLIQIGAFSRADRFTYVPLVGVFIALIWGAGELGSYWRVPKAVMIGIVLVVLAACGLRTADQLQYWRNPSVIFRHALAVTKDNDLALNNVGYDLMTNEGKVDEAINYFRRAIQINPNGVEPWGNLGFAYANKGQFAAARPYYEKALQLNPKHASTHNNLGNALSSLGKLDEAIDQYHLALQFQPDYAEAHNNLGIALAQKGDLDEALVHFRAAVQYKPGYAVAHNSLGNIFSLRGQYNDALPEYEAALQEDNHYAEAYNGMGFALAQLGRLDEAVTQYQDALRLNGDYAQAHYNLGCALMTLGRRDGAVAQFNQALRLKPDYTEAKDKLQQLTAPVSHPADESPAKP